MSRSFVRAWATVATIMAMVCLAFVQPMPEHVSTVSSGLTDQRAVPTIGTHDDGQVTAVPPFVDSISTGKTFTPYATIAARPVLFSGTGRKVAAQAVGDPLRSPPLEPPTRPG